MLLKSFVILILSFSFIKPFCQTNSSIYSQKSITVQEKKYIGFLNHYGFILINLKADTIIRQEGGYHDWQFEDFNKDGYKDILLEIASNTPSSYDLFLYDPLQNKFRQIKNFENFPASQKIGNSRFYYSYRRNGCADNDWVSDLFSLENYKIIHRGKILGNGCGVDSLNDKGSIEVFKMTSNENQNRILVEKLPYLKNIPKFEKKWDFIRRYWQKNYLKFTEPGSPKN